MGYTLVMTPEVRAWLHDLRHRDRASAILVGQWDAWYRKAIPMAEERYEDYLKQEGIR
jgi:hypothetical protein